MTRRTRSKKQMQWSRAEVPWEEGPRRDQFVVLPVADADRALQWARAVACTTWGQVAAVAPDLMDELREHAEELGWDDDEFRFEDLPGFQDGDLPPAPQLIMKYSLPREVVEGWGDVEQTMFSGDFVYFAGACQEQIVSWLVENGWEVTERPELAEVLQDPSDMLPAIELRAE